MIVDGTGGGTSGVMQKLIASSGKLVAANSDGAGVCTVCLFVNNLGHEKNQRAEKMAIARVGIFVGGPICLGVVTVSSSLV